MVRITGRNGNRDVTIASTDPNDFVDDHVKVIPVAGPDDLDHPPTVIAQVQRNGEDAYTIAAATAEAEFEGSSDDPEFEDDTEALAEAVRDTSETDADIAYTDSLARKYAESQRCDEGLWRPLNGTSSVADLRQTAAAHRWGMPGTERLTRYIDFPIIASLDDRFQERQQLEIIVPSAALKMPVYPRCDRLSLQHVYIDLVTCSFYTANGYVANVAPAASVAFAHNGSYELERYIQFPAGEWKTMANLTKKAKEGRILLTRKSDKPQDGWEMQYQAYHPHLRCLDGPIHHATVYHASYPAVPALLLKLPADPEPYAPMLDPVFLEDLTRWAKPVVKSARTGLDIVPNGPKEGVWITATQYPETQDRQTLLDHLTEAQVKGRPQYRIGALVMPIIRKEEP